MLVKMLTLAAGPTGAMRVGKTYDLPIDQAKALIEGKYAEAVPVNLKHQTPDGEPLETADARSEVETRSTPIPTPGGSGRKRGGKSAKGEDSAE